ncbi:hypothetical protein Tco_0279030, partial [Tanacetum coccineum]
DGDDGEVMMALLLWLPDGEGRRRVEESEVVGRVDPVVRTILGVDRKIPPEKFSGGGEGSPEIMGRERLLRVCVYVKEMK